MLELSKTAIQKGDQVILPLDRICSTQEISSPPLLFNFRIFKKSEKDAAKLFKMQ